MLWLNVPALCVKRVWLLPKLPVSVEVAEDEVNVPPDKEKRPDVLMVKAAEPPVKVPELWL